MSVRYGTGLSSSNEVFTAGITGASFGTLVASAAESMPAESSYRVLLIISSPLLSILVSGLWLVIKKIYIDPYIKNKHAQASKTTFVKEVELLEDVIDRAREAATRELASKTTPKEVKDNIQKRLSNLDNLKLEMLEAQAHLVAKVETTETQSSYLVP